MAEVKIIAKVDGISTEHGYVKAWETFEFKGEPRHRLWTLWTRNLDGFAEGDVVTVTGSLSTKSNSYVPKNATEPKQIVEHSLNEVSIVKQSEATTTQVRSAADIASQIDAPF